MKGSKMSRWLGVHFSTGPVAGEDYKSFQRAARSDLRTMCQSAGLTLVKFNPGHYEFSAVLQHQNGQYIYISIPDVRFWQDGWNREVLIRTMEHDKDWSGGRNHRCAWSEVAEYAVERL